ncbi:hypothetical protein F511_31935 [Dorcoceras hygrometricum]|uniref:Uncharacterized protein n=1 Tax=Dorcoceras hygrometricum TaxID=472368 RepID=A0A2Z7CN65_9LAMI|nr:hypothetical protein F511_31935 [Dorcoceras hygrometricum]
MVQIRSKLVRISGELKSYTVADRKRARCNELCAIEKMSKLEPYGTRKLHNLSALETGLVRHFADSQQHHVDEVNTLKSQVAEVIECLKELRDAPKGKGK